MDCEVCGRKIFGPAQEITIEGAKLRVCARCAKLGKPVHRPPKPQHSLRPAHTPPAVRRRPPAPPRPSRVRPRRRERELMPVEDFAQLIRTARERSGMSQLEVARRINERASVIAKLETGKMMPTIELARKLERLFKLTLLEEAEIPDVPLKSSDQATTLGDVVEIRRRKTST